jgi:hypothetical protein
VAHGRVVVLTGRRHAQAGPRVADAVEELAEILHGEGGRRGRPMSLFGASGRRLAGLLIVAASPSSSREASQRVSGRAI